MVFGLFARTWSGCRCSHKPQLFPTRAPPPRQLRALRYPTYRLLDVSLRLPRLHPTRFIRNPRRLAPSLSILPPDGEVPPATWLPQSRRPLLLPRASGQLASFFREHVFCPVSQWILQSKSFGKMLFDE